MTAKLSRQPILLTEQPVESSTPSGAAEAAGSARSRVSKGYESVDSIALTEPRIEAIRRELQALLQVVQLESNGEAIDIDGFRLSDVSDWADYPTSLSDIFWHLSSVCNFSCEFCYEKGNPPEFPIQNLPRMASAEEIDTRLRHYDPARRRGVFTMRTAINEPFANRRALEFLRVMRQKSPHELISFVTNGAYLTEEVVRELTTLQPLFFNLSIYSTNPEIRRRVLGDHRGDRAVRAVDLLAQYEVPYMTNLVMWPSIPLDDMERTIAYMAARRVTVLRVCLGGYSQYLAGDWPRYTVEEYWPTVVEAVNRLRDRYPIPLLIEPNSYVRSDTDAVVDGVIQDSPAARAGLRRGDHIVAANGRPIGSRMQLLSTLHEAQRGSRTYRPPGVLGMSGVIEGDRSEQELLSLVVRRGDREVEVVVDRYDDASMRTYPYRQIAQFGDFTYGLVVTDCLRYSSLRAARDLMERHRARRVLLLTSVMIEPMLHYMLAKTDAFNGLEVAIHVARNRYFGGTINVGDLLVVQDFVDAIQEWMAQQTSKPQLVLIPASPFASSPWGRDLCGRPWHDIERAVGVPVDLIPCPNITF